MLALLAQIDLPSLKEGGGDIDRQISLFFTALVVGFLIAVAGHVVRSKTLQIVGIVLVFAGTGLFMAAVVTHN